MTASQEGPDASPQRTEVDTKKILQTNSDEQIKTASEHDAKLLRNMGPLDVGHLGLRREREKLRNDTEEATHDNQER